MQWYFLAFLQIISDILPPCTRYINIFGARCFPGKCFHTEGGKRACIGKHWTTYKNIVIHGFRLIVLDDDDDDENHWR